MENSKWATIHITQQCNVKGNSPEMQKQRKSLRAKAPQKAAPNAYAVLKNEIARVARKEVRAETQGLKKAITSYRTEIAALKRSTRVLEKKIQQLEKSEARATRKIVSDEAPESTTRFSAKGLAGQRRRLGLSAHDCGLLIGASGQSVYKWEAGKAKPRAVHLPGISALRSMSPKDAAARLEAMA